MAFGDDLLTALAATKVKPSESPFGMAASTLSSLSPGLTNPYASVGSNIGISIGSSLLAALLSGVAKNQADKENAAFAPVLNNFLAADPTTRATMAAREPKFQSLANLLTAQELTRKADVQDAVAKEQALLPLKQEQKLFDSVVGMKEKEGMVFNPTDNQWVQVSDPIGLEVEKARRIKTIENDLNRSEPAQLPTAMIPEVSKTKGIIDEALTLSTALNNENVSWKDLQQSKIFSGLDEKGIGLQLKNLADRLARARSGAALNAIESATFDKMVGGDLSASPKQVSGLLKKLAESENRFLKTQIETALTVQKNPYNIVMPPMPEAVQSGMTQREAAIAELRRRGVIK